MSDDKLIPTFSIESFQDYILDAVPLWKDHFKETSPSHLKEVQEFAPDFKKYMQLEEARKLAIFTLRVDSVLKGYAAFILTFPMHHRNTLYAVNDAVYIDPEFRKGLLPLQFMRWCEKSLKQGSQGAVKLIQWRTKKEHDFGKVLEHLGYCQEEILYSKWIGEPHG